MQKENGQEVNKDNAAPAESGVLPEVIQLAKRFAVYQVGTGDFRIQSAAQNIRLEDKASAEALAALLEMLLEPRKAEDILEAFEPGERTRVKGFLFSLLEKGVLESGDLSADSQGSFRYEGQRVFFSHFETAESPFGPVVTQKACQDRLQGSTVWIIGLGQVGTTLVRSLALAGVGSIYIGDWQEVTPYDVFNGAWYDPGDVGQPRADALKRQVEKLIPDITIAVMPHLSMNLDSWEPETGTGYRLVIACPDFFVPAVFDRINLVCLKKNIPWINYRRLGFEITIGPLVIPGQTPCYKCAELRCLSNLSEVSERLYLHEYLNHQGRMETGYLPIATGADVLAVETIKYLSGFSAPSTIGNVLQTGLVNPQTRLRPLLKIPRCPHCGMTQEPRPKIDTWAHSNES